MSVHPQIKLGMVLFISSLLVMQSVCKHNNIILISSKSLIHEQLKASAEKGPGTWERCILAQQSRAERFVGEVLMGNSSRTPAELFLINSLGM